MQSQVHTPEYAQIDLGEQKITCPDKLYLPHTLYVKQGTVLKCKKRNFTIFFYWLFLPFPLKACVRYFSKKNVFLRYFK